MKTWWGLGASALSLVIIVLSYAAMTAGLPTVERLSRNEASPGIDVPVVGTVGDYPDPAHRHVVNVFADGRIEVEGRELSYEELEAELKRLGDADRWTRHQGEISFTSESVVLRLDGRLPWAATMQVTDASIRAGFWRIWFCVRHEADRSEGAFGWLVSANGTAPLEGRQGGMVLDLHESWQREVRVVCDGGGRSPADLFDRVRGLSRSANGELHVWLDFDLDLPTGVALELVDAAVRARATSIGCSTVRYGSLPRFEDAATSRLPEGKRGYSITVRGTDEASAGAASPMPDVARVRGEVRALWPDSIPPDEWTPSGAK